ncbi:hypothetical protein NA56DRAFT_564513, partial [Hyaloscypha hepaticicola]
RSFQDQGTGDEIQTGTLSTLPIEVESKRLHHFGDDDHTKGHASNDEHVRHKEKDQDKYPTEC